MKKEIELFPHQSEILRGTRDFKNVAYYLDMGLGKTFVGSEKMQSIGNQMNILICQKSKVADWKEHFETFYDFRIYDLTNKKEFTNFVSRDRTDTANMVCIINYELAWRRLELLKELKHFTLMLDESSLIQNRKAKQSKFILKLKPDNVILLSGTPTAGKYENLWTQCHLIGWDIKEKTYNQHYVNWEPFEVGSMTFYKVDPVNPYKHVERLKSKIREHGGVFMKTEECFELPEQTFIDIRVKSSAGYRKFMKTDVLITPELELIGDTPLTKRLYARKLCGEYSKEKLQAFRELAESTKDRLIVFYNFNAELDALKQIATELERPISEVNGHKKDMRNYDACDDSISFIQYQAGAMGLNLQKANKIVYFTLPERSELFEQSKKRIHRIGQEKSCFYYTMKCINSIEDAIQRSLNEKRDFTDELFREAEAGI